MKQIIQPLYEDNHLLILNKPAGVLVQGDNTGDCPLLEYAKDYIKEKYDKPGAVFLAPVHRLDRPVSGAIIFARTSKGAERMSTLFQKRNIQKVYWAVVRKKPKEQKTKLVNWLIKDRERNVVTCHDYPVEGAQKAELYYKVLGRLNEHYLLEVRPVTGRSHQIRVQLAAIGCPIRGDVKYGFPKPNAGGDINLHSREISFVHPVKKEQIIIQAGLPDQPFWEQFLVLDDNRRKTRKVDRLA